ncbi:hypothetical protein FBUS_05878 [Fasciolopsis buskii]|uniref:Uncharacterized protein n=1 Tax=Fasciolopsis buskii TaxID=27845 RepID=A0A8E0RRT0_9TREM|nr:hypothetical protein FBUS_05878 [Fasciolopsis buski]
MLKPYRAVYLPGDPILSHNFPVQFKVFVECRRDCSSKCNHSLFAYLSNENECFTCLLECMSAFTQQAEKVGIHLTQIRRQADGANSDGKLSDSLYAPGKAVRRRRLRHNLFATERSSSPTSGAN